MPSLAPPVAPEPDPYTEYAQFLEDSFDPNSFSSSFVNAAGESGDVSAALAKLNFGAEEVTRQLKSQITQHHSALLLQAASVGSLEGDLAEVRHGLLEVEGSVTRLRRKITTPHSALSTSLTLLTRLRRASSLTRRASRFTVLARRLQGQMVEVDSKEAESNLRSSISNGAMQDYPRGSISGEGMRARGSLGGDGVNLRASISGESGSDGRGKGRRERAMAEAALTLAEIELLLESVDEDNEDDSEAMLPIGELSAVAQHVPTVEASRQRVVEEMESMVARGLDELDNPLLASSLQTAHNLSVLPSLVQSLLQDLTEAVSKKVKSCFDIASLSREMAAADGSPSTSSAFVYKSRARNEPTTVTLPQWTGAMWIRIEELLSMLGACCIKVYTLEKVLQLKRDQNTQSSFLEEAMTVLENRPSPIFWTTLSQAFAVQAKETVRSSTFMQNLLSTGYPRLLRLFQEFFSTIAVHTDTVYTQSQQSPETIIVLRSILAFETLYLTRSASRLNEAVSSSFSLSSSLASSFTSRSLSAPTANEGLSTARAIVNELDAARFDPLLVKVVAKGAARAIDMFIAKIEGLILTDHASTSLLGPIATPSQRTNADLTSALYHLWLPLSRALADHSESVAEILRPSIENAKSTYLYIANPLIMAIRREFSAVITKMHRVDYSASLNANSMMGSGGTSSYMSDLTEKLTLVRDELLGSYRVGELAKEWALDLSRFTVQTYVLHASIVKPLSESGKLKLTSDTTSLEFAISQYLSSHSLSLSSIGDQHKALRAFRPLLFLDNAELADSKKTADVPMLILLHHVLSRSSLQLPHQAHGWTEGEYVRWLNEHGEDERIKMVEGVLTSWEDKSKQAESAGEDQPLVETLRTILGRRKAV